MNQTRNRGFIWFIWIVNVENVALFNFEIWRKKIQVEAVKAWFFLTDFPFICIICIFSICHSQFYQYGVLIGVYDCQLPKIKLFF